MNKNIKAFVVSVGLGAALGAVIFPAVYMTSRARPSDMTAALFSLPWRNAQAENIVFTVPRVGMMVRLSDANDAEREFIQDRHKDLEYYLFSLADAARRGDRAQVADISDNIRNFARTHVCITQDATNFFNSSDGLSPSAPSAALPHAPNLERPRTEDGLVPLGIVGLRVIYLNSAFGRHLISMGASMCPELREARLIEPWRASVPIPA